MMTSFDEVIRGLQKHGSELTADESEMLRQLLYSDAVSPRFVRNSCRTMVTPRLPRHFSCRRIVISIIWSISSGV